MAGMRQVNERDPQPYWHCGEESVVVDGDVDPGGIYAGVKLARECLKCGARSDWVLTELPPRGTLGSPDFGWGKWRAPIPA